METFAQFVPLPLIGLVIGVLMAVAVSKVGAVRCCGSSLA